MLRRNVPGLVAVWLATVVAAGATDLHPRAVSPGGDAQPLAVASPCPTFSWTKVPGSEHYELAVYRVEAGRKARRVLAESLPGTARSWTPSLALCFEDAGRYAWSLRAVAADGQATGWAAPRLFQVFAPTAEVRVQVAGAAVPPEEPAAPAARVRVPGAVSRPDAPADELAGNAPPPGAPGDGIVISETGITIEGETVRDTATDSDLIEALACSNGDVAMHNGSDWECGSI